jgi:transglutaminase-like putative cysteine protease
MSSHRRTLATALATAAASVSLYPIFTGWLWFGVGLGSIAVVAAAGTLTRLRRLPELVCLLAGLVVLLLFLNLAFSNARSFLHLLPTTTSVRQLWDLAGVGFHQAAIYAPPVPELRGMLLLTASGIGITALLADWIAVRLGSAALAGLPLLVLFMEPFTLSIGRGFLGTALSFGLGVGGYLGLLSSEGKDRIREWEHQDPSARDAPDTRALAAAGRRVGFASVVIALFLPLVIPGLHVTRLFGGQPGIGGRPSAGGGGGGGGGSGVGFPGVDTVLSQQLNSELTSRPADVLVYTTTQASPDYLQIYALDELTDSGWRLFSQPESQAHVAPTLPAPPGLTDRAWTSEVNTTVRIADDVGPDDLGALPAPYPAVSVQAKGDLAADRSTLMLFDSGTALGGLQYTVTSLVDSPPASVLNNAPAPPAVITDHYLPVPSSYDPLRALAQSIAAGAKAKTPFEKAVALQNWLADGGFKYTLKAPAVLSASGLTAFLDKTKEGYCQQFSFAMAVLARLLGIPSRIDYGFTSGTPIGSDQWLVTTHDAHAWPELYFQGLGWLRFEPTPSGATGQGTAYAPSYTYLPGSSNSGSVGRPEPTSAPTSGTGAKGAPNNLPPNLRAALGGGNLGGQGAGAAAGGARRPGMNPWEIFGLVLAGLVVIGLAAPWTARLAIRRRRWRPRGGRGDRGRGDGPRGADIAWAHAAWRELRDDLVDYGAGCQPSESPRAVAARAGTELALAEPALAALGRIAMAEERARYSARPADGRGLRQDSVTVRRAIAVAAPRGIRWRGRLLPASVTGPALNATAQAADIFSRLTPEWLGRFGTRTRTRTGARP